MFALIIILITMIFLACAFGAFCLCKESINWRSEQMGYDLEESLKAKEKEYLYVRNRTYWQQSVKITPPDIRWRYFLDGLPVLGGCLIDDTHKHLRVVLGVCKSDLQSNLRQCQISSLH